MNSKMLLILVPNFLLGMQLNQINTPFEVPAKANHFFSQVTAHHLISTILPEQELSNQGIITSLVIRPKENQRMLLPSLHLTRTAIEGDKNNDIPSNKELSAVMLMRDDVSQALGGKYIPGDNIHVSRLHLGKEHLKDGDLLVIQDSAQQIESILLKTYIPHYACWKLLSRCGQTAHDFINSEAEFENGVYKNEALKTGYIHGTQHRLRGVCLTALKGGIIETGNTVTIMSGKQKDELLAKYSLVQDYNHWLEASKEPGAKYERSQKLKAEMRKKARLAKK